MAARFGFMESTKAGKCFYCKDPFEASTADKKVIVGYDNNVKRRTCEKCAKQMIAEGDVVATAKPKLFNRGNTNVEQQLSELIERMAALEAELKEIRG